MSHIQALLDYATAHNWNVTFHPSRDGWCGCTLSAGDELGHLTCHRRTAEEAAEAVLDCAKHDTEFTYDRR